MTFENLKQVAEILDTEVYFCDNGDDGKIGIRDLRIVNISLHPLRNLLPPPEGEKYLYLRCVDDSEEDWSIRFAINSAMEVVANDFYMYPNKYISFDRTMVVEEAKKLLQIRADEL